MNQALFSFLYNFAHRSSALDATLVFLAADLVWVVLVVVFFYLLKSKDKRAALRDIVIVFGAALVGVIVATILKNIFQTLRPFDALPSVQSLISESGFAFPSGHTTLLASIAGVLWFQDKKAGILVGLATVLVGLARIAVGVHWPIDILGGILVGATIGVLVYRIVLRVLPNVQKSLY